jgi:hypothetical protein
LSNIIRHVQYSHESLREKPSKRLTYNVILKSIQRLEQTSETIIPTYIYYDYEVWTVSIVYKKRGVSIVCWRKVDWDNQTQSNSVTLFEVSDKNVVTAVSKFLWALLCKRILTKYEVNSLLNHARSIVVNDH